MSDVTLKPGELCSLRGKTPGIAVFCENGSLWITGAGDGKDYVLQPGDVLNVASRDVVLVSALGDSSFSITPLDRSSRLKRRDSGLG
jgi:hypothetical protein